MRLLNPTRKQKVEDIIRDHHLAFIAEMFDPEAISEADYKRLKAKGMITKTPAKVDAVMASHMLGLIAAQDDKAARDVSVESLEPQRMTAVEQEAVQVARERVGDYVKGLGDKITASVRQAVSEADDTLRRQTLTQVRETVATGIEQKRTVSQIATKLRQATGDASRSWLQIATTEMHNCFEEGKANAFLRALEPGSDPMVYKRPHKDACPFCKLLYLDGNRPRAFRLSELTANGTNVGRKAKRPTISGLSATEWKPVLGAMHPWCRCTLHQIPEGMAFDKEGRLTYVGVQKALRSLTLVKDLDPDLVKHECLDV